MSFGGNGGGDGVQGTGQISGASGINGGINSANGMSQSRETVLSSLTSSGTADLRVEGNTQITGALIATIDENGNDLGNLTLDTGTLTFTDLRNSTTSNQRSAGLSTNMTLGTTTGAQAEQQLGTTELSANSSQINYSNNSHNSASNTLATLGQGKLTVRDIDNSDDLSRLNRDVTDTTRELWDVDQQEGNIDLSIDHRMFSEEGRKEIKQNLKDTKDGIERGVDTVKDVLNPNEAFTPEEAERRGLVVPDYEIDNSQRKVTPEEQAILNALEEFVQLAPDGDGEVGSIDWGGFKQAALDFENGGPKAALADLNRWIFSQEFDQLDNIDLLRAEVRQLNGRMTEFDSTTGMASNIAHAGSSVFRVGAEIIEGMVKKGSTRSARESIDEAQRWAGQNRDSFGGAASEAPPVANAADDMFSAGQAPGGAGPNNSFERSFLGSSEGHQFAGSVTPGGTGNAFAGHGKYVFGSGDATIPQGTAVTLPRENITILDETGRYIEAGDWDSLAGAAVHNPRIADNIEGMTTWLPGAKVPNYTLSAPTNPPLNIFENSTTVESGTLLDQLLQPNMGCVQWAACTKF